MLIHANVCLLQRISLLRPIRLASSAKHAAQKAFAKYNRQLEVRPVLTKAITSGVLFGTADILAQSVAIVTAPKETRRHYDTKRIAYHVAFGTCFIGPFGHYHFQLLEKTSRMIWTCPVAHASQAWMYKVAMAQFVYWSWFQNMSYLTFMSLCDGKNVEEAKEVMQNKIMGVQKMNWVFWIPVASVCFKCIPVPLQLTYTLSMNMLWSSFLSWYNNQATIPVETARIQLEFHGVQRTVDLHSTKQLAVA